MIKNNELEYLINKKLNSINIKDCVPNGLQIEGKKYIKKIITGVTASQFLIDKAVYYNADAIIVHHGYFWNNESKIITGIKRSRIYTILVNNINLYSWHLPLDINIELGNNIQFAKKLNIKKISKLGNLSLQGKLNKCLSHNEFIKILQKKINKNIFYYGCTGPKLIKKIGWCTGAGQNFIELAGINKLDAFITGEVSEQTIHFAREYKIHFYNVGHYASERYGILSLTQWLLQNYNVKVNFIDSYNVI